MEDLPPVARILTEMKIPHRVFRHVGPLQSVEQAARERGQTPDQVVRSILFRMDDGTFIMVLITGTRQVSWKTLRHYLGVSRLTMASEEEVFQETGYVTGAVSPFGLPKPIRIIIDESVLAVAEISIGSGIRGVTVILNPQDLLKVLNHSEIGQFGES
jgi:Cys-tRNA(Pro)/Cys-tRNA(Cys) deacylase